MEVLLAAPGTGKTTKIKSIIDARFKNASNILVLSFTNATINDLNRDFETYKNVKCYTLHKYALLVNHLPKNHILFDVEENHLRKFAGKVNLEFSDLCELLHCMTFEMMISGSIDFIKANPVYAEDKIGTIDLLVVDEFQDFNEVERNLLFLICKYSKDVIILGDDDQSIYSFKNADPEALIKLYNDDSNVRIRHDHICHRCPDEIVDSCTTLIRYNKIRVIKEWNKSNRSGNLYVLQGRNQESVNKYLVERINEINQYKDKESILILSSVKIATLPVIPAFDENRIDYVNFLKKDIDTTEYYLIWWLRAIFGNHRLLNIIFIVCYHKLLSKVKLIEKFKEYFKNTSTYDELMKFVLTYEPFNISLSTYLTSIPTIDEFMKKNTDFERFNEFIDKDDISNSVDEIVKYFSKTGVFDPTKVNIMTIHKSKGLQADNVFILGLTEGLLPNKSEGMDNLEAQRRLLYVGMTRAKKRLWLISCLMWDSKDIFGTNADRTQFSFRGRNQMIGKASSFVTEMGLTVKAI